MQKKYTGFIIVFALLCLIPAIVYFAFSDHSKETVGEFPSASKSKGVDAPIHIEKNGYTMDLSPDKFPVHTGKQVFALTVRSPGGVKASTDSKIPQPSVKVTMPMGSETDIAPVKLIPLDTIGQYHLETEFSMAGSWQIEVRITPEAPVMTVFLPIQQ